MATTETSIKAFLDSLSQLPGSILYRDDVSWQGLPPGNENEVLSINAEGLPYWRPIFAYAPAFYEYDGNTDYLLRQNITLVNGPYTIVGRFRSSDTVKNKTLCLIGRTGAWVAAIWLWSNHKLHFQVWDATATQVVNLRSFDNFDDDEPHTVFAEYNNLTGTVELIIDGTDQDDPAYVNRKAQAATMPATASGSCVIGYDFTAGREWKGQIGYFGFDQKSGLDWQDFMTDQGRPRPLDQTTWSEWNGQPKAWQESGALDQNLGSIGNFTRNGNVKLAKASSWS